MKIKYNLKVSQHFKLKWLKIFSYPHTVGHSYERKHSEHCEAQLLPKMEFFILHSYRACCLNYQHFLCCRTEPAQKPAFWAQLLKGSMVSVLLKLKHREVEFTYSNIVLHFNFPARSLKHSTRKLYPYYNLFNSAFSTNSFQRKLLSHYYYLLSFICVFFSCFFLVRKSSMVSFLNPPGNSSTFWVHLFFPFLFFPVFAY